jgi:predicted O-linked N-acetylglucosamine transferase (SPINDLY family)
VPSDAELALARGLEYLNANRYAEAEKIVSRVARNNPDLTNAHHLLGAVYLQSGRAAESVPHFERAVRQQPDKWQSHEGVGVALFDQQRQAEAIPHFLTALGLAPTMPGIWCNLSACLVDTEQWMAGLGACERVLELDPPVSVASNAYNNAARVLMGYGEMAAAEQMLRKALAFTKTDVNIHGGLLYCLDLTPGVTGEQALEERKRCATIYGTPPAPKPFLNDRAPDRVLRIGYVSGDFYRHSAAYIFAPVLEHHSDRVEVHCYADVWKPDDETERLRAFGHTWNDVRGWSNEQLAEKIRADQIDVLIDLSGYTARNRLGAFVLRPAPIQMTAWGYVTGTGLDGIMDAILADDVLIPTEHEHHFVERIVRVPYALGFSLPPEPVPIRPRPADRPLTFGYLGRAEKITEPTLDLWARILETYPASRLLLKDGGFQHDRVWERLTVAFTRRGIAPGRVTMRGPSAREVHLDTYNEIDVALDPLPQGGGITTIEALWMGTPVVTLLGDRIIGRISATTLHAIGLDGCIVGSEDDYIRRAGMPVQLRGSQLRDRLEHSIVCDGALRARHVEAAYRALWREWCGDGSA